MRRLTLLLCFVGLFNSVHAVSRVTVAQLEQFLTSRHALKESDGQIADLLQSVQLSEQLTVLSFKRIESEVYLGPRTTEQLRLLAALSIFLAPPTEELPKINAPDQISQQQMISSAAKYVDRSLRRLPDFLAIRTTDSFDNTPQKTGSKRAKPKSVLHFVRESHREITYRNGQEMANSSSSNSGRDQSQMPGSGGLTTWGEFGPILETVLGDSNQGTVVWSRWQTSESGGLVAVFRYNIPGSASHYLIDFCCYQKSIHDPQSYPFRSKPAYHGELFIDPASGAIDRITLEAELTEDDPVMASGIAVQYGKVSIAGKDYFCPVRGVAVSEIHNLDMELINGIASEKLINEVRFSDYHKFGSTAQVLPESSGETPH